MVISTWLELLALSVSLAVAMGYASMQQAGLAIVPWAQQQLAFVKKNVTKLEPKNTNLFNFNLSYNTLTFKCDISLSSPAWVDHPVLGCGICDTLAVRVPYSCTQLQPILA